MPVRAPIGVVSRSAYDFFSPFLAGAECVQTNVAAQNSYCELFNNAVDGSVLRVYGVDVFVTGNTFVFYEVYFGQHSTGSGSVQPYGAIDPRSGTLPGIVGGFTSAVCLGTHLGGLNMIANVNRGDIRTSPLAVIPPGYSFALQVANQNITIQCAIYWAVIYS